MFSTAIGRAVLHALALSPAEIMPKDLPSVPADMQLHTVPGLAALERQVDLLNLNDPAQLAKAEKTRLRASASRAFKARLFPLLGVLYVLAAYWLLSQSFVPPYAIGGLSLILGVVCVPLVYFIIARYSDNMEAAYVLHANNQVLNATLGAKAEHCEAMQEVLSEAEAVGVPVLRASKDANGSYRVLRGADYWLARTLLQMHNEEVAESEREVARAQLTERLATTPAVV